MFGEACNAFFQIFDAHFVNVLDSTVAQRRARVLKIIYKYLNLHSLSLSQNTVSFRTLTLLASSSLELSSLSELELSVLLESELESVESLPVVVVVCVVVVAVLSWDPRRNGLFTFSSATTLVVAWFAVFSSTTLVEPSSVFSTSLLGTVSPVSISVFASISVVGGGAGATSDVSIGFS